MSNFNKWGHTWRKKFSWGQEFTSGNRCIYATENLVKQDQNNSTPLLMINNGACRNKVDDNTEPSILSIKNFILTEL